MIWNDCILIQQYLSALQVIRIKIFIFQLRWVEGAVIIYANQIKFTYVTLDHNLRHCLLRLPLQKWSIASIFITWPICYPMMGLVKVTRLFHPMNSKQNEAAFILRHFQTNDIDERGRHAILNGRWNNQRGILKETLR